MCVCVSVNVCVFIRFLLFPFGFWQIYWKHSENKFLIQQLIINFILTFSAPFRCTDAPLGSINLWPKLLTFDVFPEHSSLALIEYAFRPREGAVPSGTIPFLIASPCNRLDFLRPFGQSGFSWLKCEVPFSTRYQAGDDFWPFTTCRPCIVIVVALQIPKAQIETESGAGNPG